MGLSDGISKWIERAIVAIVVIVPFSFEKQIGGVWVTTADIVVAGVIALWIATLYLKRGEGTVRMPILSLVISLIILLMLSGLRSISIFQTVKETLKYTLILGFFYACVNNLRNRGVLLGLPRVVTATAVLISLWFLADFVRGNVSPITIPWERLWYRRILSYQHLNTLGTFLVITIPFGFYEMLRQGDTRRKLLYGLGNLLQITALFFTYSRANWVSLIVAMSCFLCMKYRLKGVVYVVLFMVVPFAVFSFAFPGLNLKERLISMVDKQDGSAITRKQYMTAAIQMMGAMPLTGVGAGNFKIAAKQYRTETVDDMVHNMFLQIGVEAGIIALLVLVAIIIMYYYDAYNLYVSLACDTQLRDFLILGIVSFTGLMISSQFGDPFVRSIKEYFALLLALPYAVQSWMLKDIRQCPTIGIRGAKMR